MNWPLVFLLMVIVIGITAAVMKWIQSAVTSPSRYNGKTPKDDNG